MYGADVDIWHVRANVYAFRMPAARVVVDADFASTPSTYRVYVANTRETATSAWTKLTPKRANGFT